MGRLCTVCEHPKRKAIEAALAEGAGSNRQIAARFKVAEQSVRRHKKDHLHRTMAATSRPIAAHETIEPARPSPPPPAEVAHADSLVDQVADLQRRTLRLLEKAEEGAPAPLEDGGGVTYDYRGAAALIGQARGCLELQAKLLGQLQAASVTINIAQHPDAQRFLREVYEALLPHPEAMAAVRERLAGRGAAKLGGAG